jgi:hypothetical protein
VFRFIESIDTLASSMRKKMVGVTSPQNVLDPGRSSGVEDQSWSRGTGDVGLKLPVD